MKLCMVLITTKALKSCLKLLLEKFNNQEFSYPGKGDTSSPGPHPPKPWPFRPQRILSTLLMLLILSFYKSFLLFELLQKH